MSKHTKFTPSGQALLDPEPLDCPTDPPQAAEPRPWREHRSLGRWVHVSVVLKTVLGNLVGDGHDR